MSEDLLKAYEQGLIELDHLRRIDKLNKEEFQAYERKIISLEKLLSLCEKQRVKESEIDNQNNSIKKIDEKIFNEFQTIVNDLKLELERVRKSRDRYRNGLKYAFGIGAILGAALSYLFKN